MELELGLALPNHNPMMIKELDLNSSNNALEMEHPNQKRRLHDDQHGIEFESKLPLLLWSGGRQPDEEDDAGRRPKSRKFHLNDENTGDEENQLETNGWPHCHHGGLMAAEGTRNSVYVKVKMEGVAIGRKVDLRHYDCYDDLKNTLINMFAKYCKIDGNREMYTLLYQDKEGDWMLVGDIQWERFVESVQRLELLKNGNGMGFRLLSRKSYS